MSVLRCVKAVGSRNTTAHSEPQLRIEIRNPAVQSDIYWYHQVQGVAVKHRSPFPKYKQRKGCAEIPKWLKKESSIQGACVSPELQEILAPWKRKGFRTDAMKRSKDNVTLFFPFWRENMLSQSKRRVTDSLFLPKKNKLILFRER